MIRCKAYECKNGRLIVECCSGSNCSCRGAPVDIGICLVCNGAGYAKEDANLKANFDFLRSLNVSYYGYSLDGNKRIGE